jgi:hypothetical protein
MKLKYLSQATHTGSESREIRSPANNCRHSNCITLDIHGYYKTSVLELTSEKIKGRTIMRLAISPLRTPALMKKAMDTAQTLTSVRIRKKTKNLSTST